MVTQSYIQKCYEMEEIELEEKVSVIVPVYNSEKYVEETIRSILSQTYNNFEVIIVDDGSTDLSGEICDKLALEDERIVVFHKENSGPVNARNYAIEMSAGTYILPVDSDDIIAKEYIEEAVNIIEKDIDIGIVYCKAELIGDKTGLWDIPNYSLPEMLIGNCIFATALFRRDDWEIVGGYSELMKDGIEDYDLWLSILGIGRTVYQIPKVYFYYRKHAGSRSELYESDVKKVQSMENIKYYRHKDIFMRTYRVFDKENKIALYGAGMAGKTYYNFLKSLDIDIACWVDKNYGKQYDNGRNIVSKDELNQYEFDYIVIAINNKKIVEEVAKDLSEYCDGNRIVWYLK